jgi:hypothetical protein
MNLPLPRNKAAHSGASGSYTYDGNGLRVQRVSGSTTTVYISPRTLSESGPRAAASFFRFQLKAGQPRDRGMYETGSPN